jgi:hypothetical protein
LHSLLNKYPFDGSACCQRLFHGMQTVNELLFRGGMMKASFQVAAIKLR